MQLYGISNKKNWQEDLEIDCGPPSRTWGGHRLNHASRNRQLAHKRARLNAKIDIQDALLEVETVEEEFHRELLEDLYGGQAIVDNACG
jgi:hypothetical protein